MSGGGPCVFVYPDRASLASAAAALVLSKARGSVERRGRFVVALAGGETPRDVYRLLAAPGLTEAMPWTAVHVLWGDERCVDPREPLSNEGMAREALLDHVPIPPQQVHPIRCGSGDGDGIGGGVAGRAAAAVAGYEALLRDRFPVADLVLLGLGADGHTASLYPGSEALRETQRWVVPIPAGHGGTPGPPGAAGAAPGVDRVTLTLPYLNRARSVAFVVAGGEKAATVRRVLEQTAGSTAGREAGDLLPAARVRPRTGRPAWYLDEAAAASLDLSIIAPRWPTAGAGAFAPIVGGRPRTPR